MGMFILCLIFILAILLWIVMGIADALEEAADKRREAEGVKIEARYRRLLKASRLQGERYAKQMEKNNG